MHRQNQKYTKKLYTCELNLYVLTTQYMIYQKYMYNE